MSGDIGTSNTLNLSSETHKEHSNSEERLVDGLQAMMDSSFEGLGDSSILLSLQKLDSPILQPEAETVKKDTHNPSVEEKSETEIVPDILDDTQKTEKISQEVVEDKDVSQSVTENNETSQSVAEDKDAPQIATEGKEESQVVTGDNETPVKSQENENIPISPTKPETDENPASEEVDSSNEKSKEVITSESAFENELISQTKEVTRENKNTEELTASKEKSDINFTDEFGMTEQEALAFLKEEEEAKKAAAGSGPPKIQVYGSSVSGNMRIKKAQNKILDTLDRFNIEYEFVDLAADGDAKLFIKRKNPNSTAIPQIYLDGEFKMEIDEFEELLEYDELFDALGVDPDF